MALPETSRNAALSAVAIDSRACYRGSALRLATHGMTSLPAAPGDLEDLGEAGRAMPRRVDPVHRWLKWQTFFLSMWGCWPRGRYKLYYAYTACFVVIYANHFYSSLYGISRVLGDLDKVLTFANNSSITMPACLIFATVLTHRGNIRQLCEVVEAFCHQPEVAKHLHVLERTRRIMRNLTLGTLLMGVLDSLTWCLTERSVTSVFAYANRTNPLPFDRYLPFEPSASAPAFHAAKALLSFEFTLSVCTFLSTDMASLALLAYASSQLEVLLRCLASLRQDSLEHVAARRQGQAPAEQEVLTEMRRRLKVLVDLHRSVLRYVNDLQNMIGMLMIVVFFALTFMICLSLFQAVTRDMSFRQTYKFASACIHATVEVFIYCRLGESITSKSGVVGTTLYFTDWYDEPDDLKKAYLVIMTRSDRAVVVRAKPFYDVNMATFVSVMNAAYTYFNLMREFNK